MSVRAPVVWGSAALVAAAFAWGLFREAGPATVPAGEPQGAPASPSAAPSEAAPLDRPTGPGGAVPPADDGVRPPAEAVVREGERLREIRVGDRPRAARFRAEVFRDGMELSGDVVLAGLVEGRDVWVRWDTEATRTRFLGQRIPMPGMQVTEGGEAIVFLQPFPDLLRHLGFSCRLEGSVLRIGAEGVYPGAPPTVEGLPEGLPEVPPPGPSPR